MNEFDNFKKEWKKRVLPESQTNGHKEVIQKGKLIRMKQTIGQAILSATTILLIAFFFYISAYKNPQVSIGLMLMIGSLIIRVVIEFAFKFKANNQPYTEGLSKFNRSIIKYYKSRLYINYLITPILFISYIIGFILLLPAFKESLSSGFYTYIIYSSWVILGLLAVLIFVQIKKELKNIESLKIIEEE